MTNNMTFKLNSETYKWLADNNLQIEDLFVLKVFELEDLKILQNYLFYKSSDQKLVYFQKFIRLGLLANLVEVEEFSWDNYVLTEEAEKILKYWSELGAIEVEEKKEEIKQKLVVDPEVIIVEEKEKTPFDLFVEEFRAKFPEGRNDGGVSFRGNPIDVKNKLHKFMNKYKKYTFEIISKATDLYLAGFKRKGFAYCQAAEYFILKNSSSTLAGYCEMVVNSKDGKVGNITDPFEQQM